MLLSQSTSNNTSACSANGVPTAGCNGVGAMPFIDLGDAGAQTTTLNPLPTFMSPLDVHQFLYAGATTRTMSEYQPWFCNTSTPCNGHKVIGMQESNSAQILLQAKWMKTIGMDVTDVDWYGCADYCTTPQSSAQHYNNQVTLALASAIATNPTVTPKLMIMIDGGAINSSGTGQCPPAGGDQSGCLIAALNTQVDYLAQTWLFQSYYEKNTNGHPIVLYFVNQPSWGGTNFNTVFAAVAAHATSGNSCGSGCTYSATVDFVDENAGAFGESGIAGGYAWPQPTVYSITNQFCWQGSSCFDYLADFYTHARANPSQIAMGVIYKAFNDTNAGWGSDRVIAGQCGQVLNLTANKIGSAGYNSGSQLQYVQFATWNDYEEGTEIETGVDNCYTVGTPSIAGGNISWSLTKSDATYAVPSTINSMSIYTGAASPTTLYASGISPSTTTFAAPTSGQNAWVYMNGGPLIQNRLSALVAIPVSGVQPWVCYQPQGGITNAVAQIYILPHKNCVAIPVTWSLVDKGTTQPLYDWTFDTANVTPYWPGFNIGTCTTASSTSTCGVTSATFTNTQYIVIQGNTGCNGVHQLTAASGSSVSFPSTCAGTGGTAVNACGSLLASGGQVCQIGLLQLNTLNNGNANNPAYVFTHTYANAQTPAWLPNTTYGFHSSVTHAGHFFHSTTLCAAGPCSEATFGAVITWVDDGATNAFLQEVTTGGGFPGDAQAPPASLYTNNGITWNADSNVCGSAGTSNCGTVETGGAMPAAFPVYWGTPMQAALKNFCNGVDGSSNLGMLPHYNATLGSHLLFIACGAPQGSEWFGALEPYFLAQYSMNFTQWSGLYINYGGNAIWNAIHTEFLALGSPATWGMIVPNGIYANCNPQPSCNVYSDLIANVSLLFSENSPANLGTRAANLSDFAVANPVQGDWIGIATRFPDTRYHLYETLSPSCPTLTGGCSGVQTTTGDLGAILPFIESQVLTGKAVPIIIPFGVEDACAWDPTFVATISGGNYPACPYTRYQSILTNITNPIPPLSANLQYCQHGIPTWGVADSVATLPATCYHAGLATTPSTGTVVNVSTATQLTAALAVGTAQCGQQVTLQAGATFSGHFTIPALVCPAFNYFQITTSGLVSLPTEGASYSTVYNGVTLYPPQFGPCYAGVVSLPGRPTLNCPATSGTYTAKIITPDSQPALKFTTGTSGVRIMGLEITRTPGTGFVSELLKLENLGAIDHIVIDRVWCHGDENQDETEACFYTSAISNIASVDSYYNNFYCISGIGVCSDAKAIGGGANTLNSVVETGIKLVDNFFEASGENILYGGGGSNTVPVDFEVRLNDHFKPRTWNPSDPAYNGGISGHPFIVKNLFEFKNGQRVLIEGNTFVNNWAQAQNGTAILFTPKNGTNNCLVCLDSGITFRYNWINSAGSVAQLVVAKSDLGFFAAGGNRYSFHDNVADNLNYATCNCSTGIQTFLMWSDYTTPSSAQVEHDVVVNHNTAVYASTSGNPGAAIGLSGPLISTGFNMFNMTFTNNVALSGSTGTSNTIGGGIVANCAEGTTGIPELNACWTNYTFGGNCFINNGSVTWPGSNITSLLNQTVTYTNYNNGNGGDYTLLNNACKGQAIDLLDPGANIPKLISTLSGGSSGGFIPSISPTGLIITIGAKLTPGSFIRP